MIRKKGSLIIENMLASVIILMVLLVIFKVVVRKAKWQIIKELED